MMMVSPAAPRSSWSVPPDFLAQLRLDAARSALTRGEHVEALVEAEELLADLPNHLEALGIAGAAALHMGNAVVAAEAYGRILELRHEDADAHASLAMARFATADLEGAYASSQAAVALRADLPEAWYYLGLAAERLRRRDEAAQAFARAEALAPARYPEHRTLPDGAWVELLRLAIERLPERLQAFYTDIPTQWETFPDLDELLAVDPPLSPFTDALYDGTPPVDGDPWDERPAAIRLFRGNLSRPAVSADELTARIARALLHEALDWLGLTWDELESGAEPVR